MKKYANRLHALRVLRGVLADVAASQRPEVKADINVTPLVDVVLVLLIIFMVVTPMITSGVPVDLPRTANHFRKADDGRDIMVAVTADKKFYVGSMRVADATAATQAVLEERRRSPQKTIFVKADTRAPYGAVRLLMEAMHAAEIEDIILGTEEVQKR